MTEVVTPSGKGWSFGPPVATEIRSRVQLFCGSEIDYMRLFLVVGMDKTPGFGPHDDEGVGIY
jgi:hypothetical protein